MLKGHLFQSAKAQTNLIKQSPLKFFSNNTNTNDRDNIFCYLNERKLINNISHQDLIVNQSSFDKFLKSSPKMYIGFDPTAESLHLGNLIGILTAVRFAAFGIEPVFLLGGATGQIGDPSGKNKERPLLQKDKIHDNLSKIEGNIKNLMENIKGYEDIKYFFNSKRYLRQKTNQSSSDEEDKLIEVRLNKINSQQLFKDNDIEVFMKNMEIIKKENLISKGMIEDKMMKYQIIDNNMFYKDLNIIDFLREVGVNLRMGPLLSRETVKNRLNTKEGLSLTEFMYQTFQGFDYLKLLDNFNVRIQIGGSDQWGNMLAGYELIKKTRNIEVVNMTFPLMTTANGQKFGKSEGNAVFINPDLTPINKVYQYFYNLADADLHKMLNAFTFIETSDIDTIIHDHQKQPEKRIAQKLLAEKVVGMLFSEDEVNKCKKNCQAHYTNFSEIFKKNFDNASNFDEIDNLLKDCQVTEISDDFLEKSTISNFCVTQKILTTKAQCRRLIQSGSLSINNSKIQEDVVLNRDMFLKGKYMVLKTGKKNTHIFQIKRRPEIIMEKMAYEQTISQ